MKNTTLIRVNRFIEIEDPENEDSLVEINIDHISLEQLLQIFEPYERGDPYLYDPYSITSEQLEKLNVHMQEPVGFNRGSSYTLAAYGVYVDNITGAIIR